MTSTYIPATAAAKFMRKALKTSFPGIKFSVRTYLYSMGASIHVHYNDARLARTDVAAVADKFQGSDFDGMTDRTNRRVFVTNHP